MHVPEEKQAMGSGLGFRAVYGHRGDRERDGRRERVGRDDGKKRVPKNVLCSYFLARVKQE